MADFDPPRASSPFQSGGGGFTYADRVGARILLAMLAREFLLGASAGTPIDVRFEQRPLGELFDDIVVRTDKEVTWAISIKSGEVINNDQISEDLIDRAWWMLKNQSFDSFENSLLVIAQPPPLADEHRAFTDLVQMSLEQAAGQAEVFASQKWVSNDAKRKLWEFVKSRGNEDPQQLFRKLRLLGLDLDPALSNDLTEVRKYCESILSDPNQWEALWNSLLAISAAARSTAAQLTSNRLVSKIPDSLILQNFGPVTSDWQLIRERGRIFAPRNRFIGGKLQLDNAKTIERLNEYLSSTAPLILSGESGVGKSVALAEWVEATNAVYLRADVLEFPNQFLGLAGSQRALEDLLRLTLDRWIIVVIDQIDRVESDESWAVFKSWITLLIQDKRVKLVFGCATSAIAFKRTELARLLETEITEITMTRSDDEVIAKVRESFPEAAELLKTYAPSPLLDTPRALDQLLKMGLSKWPSTFDEYLGLFWLNRIQGGTGDANIRDQVRRIAESEAELGVGKLAEDIDSKALGTLKERGLIIDDGTQLSWDHDTTGDYIRAQVIKESAEDADFGELLSKCVLNPMWRRALLLYFVTVLEREGAPGFSRLRELLSTTESGNLLELSLFDAVIECRSDLNLPCLLGDHLLADRKTAQRYVARFLYSASTPTKVYKESYDNIYSRANLRDPIWKRWLPTVRLVVQEHAWFCKNEPELGLEVLYPYLEAVAGGNDFLNASRVALTLAYQVTLERRSYGQDSERACNIAFRVSIATLLHAPKPATKFLRRCAGRKGRVLTRDNSRIGYLDFGEKFQEPWSIGPSARILDTFQKFYLMSDWPATVSRNDPALAKELFYACIIQEPGMVRNGGFMRDSVYGVSEHYNLPFFPATHLHPGLNGFFSESFEKGFEVVSELLDFALERWISQYEEPDDVGISIRWGENDRWFRGDQSVYHWHSGASTAPYVLQSLLLTLERHLLEQIDLEEQLRRINYVLDHTDNVAILAVLCCLAKSNEALVCGVLAPVLFSEEIDFLDIQSSVAQSWFFTAGLATSDEYWRDQNEAYRFSRLPHRQLHLRQFAISFMWNGDPQLAEQARVRWLKLAESEDPETAHQLRLLSTLYDRDSLEFTELEDGRVQITAQLPDDVQQFADEAQAESNNAFRSVAINFHIQKALDSSSISGAIAEELLADLERSKRDDSLPIDRFSSEIGVHLVCLLAGLNGEQSPLGTALQTRQKLLDLIASSLDHPSNPVGFDDQSHWPNLISNHAAIVFEVEEWTEHSRRALIALVQSSERQAFHRLVSALRNIPGREPLCVDIIRIGRDWAVEIVRRLQFRTIHQHPHSLPKSQKAIPNSKDLGFSENVYRYVNSGVWSFDDNAALGYSDPNSAFHTGWGPSAYPNILSGLLEMLESTQDAQIENSLLPILKDVLSGIKCRESHDDYDRSRTESWSTLGWVLPNLKAQARGIIEREWADSATSNSFRNSVEAALGLTTALLRSYSNGSVTLENATTAFVELVAEYRSLRGSDHLNQFYRYCLGIGSHGIGVDWTEDRGTAWIKRNSETYEEIISHLFANHGVDTGVVRRLRRKEFRQLDSCTFAAIASRNHIADLTGAEDKSYLAELLIELAPIAKRNPENRKHWRRMLAELELVGDVLAWQVVTEVSATV